MSEAKHEIDQNGICWKIQVVKGAMAWILCGRASYEAVIRCDEHSPLLPPDQLIERVQEKCEKVLGGMDERQL